MATTNQLDPALPPRENLEALALEVARGAAALAASLPDRTAVAFRDLVRIADAHHSLSIDGHRVHPLHLEQALRSELAEVAAVRALQREGVAYIKVDRFLAGRIAAEPALDVASPAFLKLIHWELYARVPEEFRWVATPDGSKQRVVPGEIRSHPSIVGGRPAPAPAALESLLGRFRGSYEMARLAPVDRILAVGASHHRLLWIHPFGAGNGRVARLFGAAMAHRAGIDGALGGLWSVSRGLARAREKYRTLLAAADARQLHDLDGRDVLSPRGLLDFTRFYLETMRDEIAFMRSALRLETLCERLARYVALRGASVAPGGPLRSEATLLLREVALRGEVPRGEAGRVTGMAPSEARKVLSALVSERLLISDSPKGPVRLGVPTHAAPFLVPDLYSADVILRDEPRSVIEAA